MLVDVPYRDAANLSIQDGKRAPCVEAAVTDSHSLRSGNTSGDVLRLTTGFLGWDVVGLSLASNEASIPRGGQVLLKRACSVRVPLACLDDAEAHLGCGSNERVQESDLSRTTRLFVCEMPVDGKQLRFDHALHDAVARRKLFSVLSASQNCES